jgi:hypothetical protein
MRRSIYLFAPFLVTFAYACSQSSNGDLDDDGTPPGPDASTSGSDGSVSSDAAANDGSAGDGSVLLPDGGRDLGTDTTKFYGASRCSTAGVLLCDGFETGTLDTSTWTVNGNAPVIDSVHAARGSNALHITKNGNGASYIKETKTFPVTNDTYYGREFVWFENIPVDDGGFTYAHWTFTAASGSGAQGEIRLSAQLQGGHNIFGVGTDTGTEDGGSGDWTKSDNDPTGHPVPVPTGQWICIEWMHAGNINETRFYWNGAEHPSLHTTATSNGGNGNPYILPQFQNVWVGWQEYQPAEEDFEMWIDEVAIDTARIGCVL